MPNFFRYGAMVFKSLGWATRTSYTARLHNIKYFSSRSAVVLAVALSALLQTFNVYSIEDVPVPNDKLYPGYHLKKHAFIDNTQLKEVSGLAVSTRNPGVLWALNDSGGKSFLYALDAEGNDLGTIEVVGAQNVDWEDLSAFQWRGKSYLLVADVGDNLRSRDTRTLYIIEEPKLLADKFYNQPLVEPVNKLKFRFDSGALDCQAVAVDVFQERIFLISKSESPPVLYVLPLSVEQSPDIAVAARSTAIPSVPQPTLAEVISSLGGSYFNSQPTGFDISAAGDRAVVVTYNSLLYYENKERAPWSHILSEVEPSVVPIEQSKRIEAVSISADGSEIYVSSEEEPAPIFLLTPTQSETNPPEQHSVE